MGNQNEVKAWKEQLIIPTYEVGTPEKYPVFLEKRVYQGSSGVVYPFPVIEKISDTKADKEWEVLFLENDFIRTMIIPALGGRIQMAYDKIRNRHFIYYNQVIKPALVGLTGPWISGGIEFNWPQHHRPSTYEPVDYNIEHNSDGSVTVWVSEIERMFRTKGMAGFTLYPDKAYLEVKVQLYNRTPLPQTFLWWANPAVAANDEYQSVFPPDVRAVFDHGRRDVSEFPIAKNKYYHVDYSPGTDISRYKNIPVPTSYMAASSNYDFLGGYEHDTQGGLLHVADHHISPGKKQWTWGNGNFGHAWDRNLTDDDGPYVELMCGVFTDNQPDFSWLQPYEEKSFSQYFLPYHKTGLVKNATKEALVNIEFLNGDAVINLFVTSNYPGCRIEFKKGETEFHDIKDLDPATPYQARFAIKQKGYEGLTFNLYDQDGNELVSWSPDQDSEHPLPEPAKAIGQPEDIESIEDLFLSGLHLEQYRHATYDPTAYYLEALRRSPSDVRCNNAMGLWYLRRCKLNEALSYFNASIKTLTEKNPNPYDGEPFFNKGLTLQLMGRVDDAFDAFYKACWNAAWQDSGYFHLAQISCRKGDFADAHSFLKSSLIKNWHHHKARHLQVAVLRKVSSERNALSLIDESLAIDNFNFGVLFEKYLITNDEKALNSFKEILRDQVHNYIECSLDYAQAGCYQEAIRVLNVYKSDNLKNYPMVDYFIGWYHHDLGDIQAARKHFDLASRVPKDYCFPNRVEEVLALKTAIKTDAGNAPAYYYLGNYWYAYKQYDDALNCWEKATNLDPANAICKRNLALLYFNKENQKNIARRKLEEAFSIDSSSPRLLMELDQLYKRMNAPLHERYDLLKKNINLVNQRDDLFLEWASLHALKGENEIGLKFLMERHFHPWEGGEGKVTFQYVMNNIELAKKHLVNKEFNSAIHFLEAARIYPDNLGEGKLFGAQENDIDFWLGCVYHRLADFEKAKEHLNNATVGQTNPSTAFFYNDQQPDKLFYKGLSHLLLGQKDEGNKCFDNLLDFGNQHKEDNVKLDYFAVSLPNLLLWEEDLDRQNQLTCMYLIGLGYLGKGKVAEARKCFEDVLAKDQYHFSSSVHLALTSNDDLLNYIDHVRI